MQDKRTLLWLQKKQQSLQVQMHGIFVAFILKIQSVISVEKTSTFDQKSI